MATAGLDSAEAYVLKKLYKEKKETKNKSEKCVMVDEEPEKVSASGCFCWKVKKARLSSDARSKGSAEEVQHQTLD
ncbi:hypothetical protein HanIR_Chr07g0315051 [Helianthus annuus]|nr:hypothetical protein HanIR_Chr07g0315051 [Helianthus annuus]